MHKKLLILSIFILSTALIRPVFVFSQSGEGSLATETLNEINQQIAEKKKNIEELEKSIAEAKKNIEKKRLETNSLKNQVSILENRELQITLDIDLTEEKLETILLEIESLETSIESKEKTIDKQKTIIAELVRNMHYESGKSYVEIMASNDSFSEFYNKLQYLQTVEKDIGKSAKSIRLAKADLVEKKEATEERQTAYEKLRDDLNNKKLDLQEQKFAKEILVAETKASEAVYQTQLASLKSIHEKNQDDLNSAERRAQELLASQERQNNLIGTNSSELSWPTNGRFVTAYFYDQNYPYRKVFEHPAIDIRASHGTPIRAAAAGYVARAKTCTSASCYSYIMIAHAGGLSTVYGHTSKIIVSEDQFVARGDIIGYSGATPGTVGAGPFTTGPHLHLEVRKNGIPVNPLDYLVKDY